MVRVPRYTRTLHRGEVETRILWLHPFGSLARHRNKTGGCNYFFAAMRVIRDYFVLLSLASIRPSPQRQITTGAKCVRPVRLHVFFGSGDCGLRNKAAFFLHLQRSSTTGFFRPAEATREYGGSLQ